MEFSERKTIRLQDYDYSQNGAYFVTICTKDKQHSLGYIRRDDPCGCPSVQLTQLGEIVKQHIEIIEKRYDIKCDKFVIMPNHVHLIIMMQNPQGNGHPQGASLQQIVGGYKSLISTTFLKICKENGLVMGEIWQRSYHEHVIRSEKSYQEIWQYIDTNPIKWELDCYYTI